MTNGLVAVQLYFTVVDRPFRLACDRERISPNWQDWLVRELRALRYDLQVDEGRVRVFKESNEVGRLAFRSVDDIAKERGDEDWFYERSPCPWVGGVMGYVEFQQADLPRKFPFIEWAGDLAGRLGYLCVGPVIDLYTGAQVHQPLEEKQYPLTHCLEPRRGFYNAVISEDEKYMTMIETEINDRLRKIGIASRVYAASHPPLDLDRYTAFYFGYAISPKTDPIVDLQGKPIRRPWNLLSKEFIGLWNYEDGLARKIGSVF